MVDTPSKKDKLIDNQRMIKPGILINKFINRLV